VKTDVFCNVLVRMLVKLMTVGLLEAQSELA